MKKDSSWGLIIAGVAAGAINGLFGGGGGMVLVPLLTLLVKLPEESVFPASVSIILPICLVSLVFSLFQGDCRLEGFLPYLIGSFLGGICAGLWGKKISPLWLHRILGVLILWGGFRYLW